MRRRTVRAFGLAKPDLQCHCSLCRKDSGVASTPILIALEANPKWLAGEGLVQVYTRPTRRGQHSAERVHRGLRSSPSGGAIGFTSDAWTLILACGSRAIPSLGQRHHGTRSPDLRHRSTKVFLFRSRVGTKALTEIRATPAGVGPPRLVCRGSWRGEECEVGSYQSDGTLSA